MSEPNPTGRDAKAEFLAEFQQFVAAVFPGLPEDSHQYVSLRRAFLAGAATAVELISRPHESDERALEWIAGIYVLGKEEIGKPADPRRAKPDEPN